MLEKLKGLALRYEDLEAQLVDPAVYGDAGRLRDVNRELKELAPIAEVWRDWEAAERRRADAEASLRDPDLRELAQEELSEAKAELRRLEEWFKALLLPGDPDGGRDVVLELRAGVGGEEAALFAGTLLRMYTLYAQSRGWKLDVVSMSGTELGGVKECSVLVEGAGAFSRLKYESGVHQVKRVPETESSGRIQTSTATVAVLPSAEEVDVEIDPKDIQTDTYRSSGAGGQHINKTESAIRITHLPTGMVVTCQDERSQYKNRDKAMRVLRSRLYQRERESRDAAAASERKSQVGGGWRSEKVRTYRFLQSQVVEHRIGLTVYRLDAVLNGDLDEIIDGLVTADQAQRLRETEG